MINNQIPMIEKTSLDIASLNDEVSLEFVIWFIGASDAEHWRGRGAFCRPEKVSREASWRWQKRLCRHK
jgi:hypothetical protein